MLQDHGIVGKLLTEALLDVHKSLQEACVGLEHFTITNLLHAATLASQQLERGIDIGTSLRSGMIDGYANCTRDRTTKQVVTLMRTDTDRHR